MLPQYRHLMSKDVAAITVQQLLTMTSGIGEDDVTTHDRELKAKDFVAEISGTAPM